MSEVRRSQEKIEVGKRQKSEVSKVSSKQRSEGKGMNVQHVSWHSICEARSNTRCACARSRQVERPTSNEKQRKQKVEGSEQRRRDGFSAGMEEV